MESMDKIVRAMQGSGKIHLLIVTVQDGGKTGAKAGVKLAYKHDFAPVFTSDEHPMLLVRLTAGQEDEPS